MISEDYLAPIAQGAQPMHYATCSFIAPPVWWDDPVPNWNSTPESDVEIIERKPNRLRNVIAGYAPPFVGCGRKLNPIFILRATGLLSALRPWTKKCGSEKGTSGQFFICADCAIKYGYRW
jgi:hypothetical protein